MTLILTKKVGQQGPKKATKGKNVANETILPQTKNSIPSFLTQHVELPVGVHMQKNEVNWAKNDRVRAVFVDNVKTLENKSFTQNRNF